MDKTLAKGLRVLEHVARSPEPLDAADVAAALGMTRSNAYRTLQTLVSMKFLARVIDKYAYAPAVRLFELGTLAAGRYEVTAHALPVLVEVAARAGESAVAAVLDEREVVYVERVESPRAMGSVLRAGQRMAAHCSASGKLLLAFAPDHMVCQLEGTLVRFTDRTVTTMAALRADLATIVAQDFAEVVGEWHPDVAALAVPIRNASGRVIAALGVSGPAARLMPHAAACLDAARWGADEIRRRL